jgi:hypothetical protein
MGFKNFNTKETKELFQKFELTSRTWDLEESGKRF